jgi:TonB family protein
MKATRTLLVVAFALVLATALGATTSPRTVTPAPRETVFLPYLNYPIAWLHKGITGGEVRVLLKIGPDARLIDSLVTSYTRKELADFTRDALTQAKFQPMLVDERPVTTIIQLVMRFETRGMVVIERHAADGVDRLPGQYDYEPCDPSRLDRPLQPITVVSPAYAPELGRQGAKGSVVLEYYIDESGRVRMPIVNATENETLAGLSLAAIEQWQFNPPLSGNKPVLVRVKQTFEFVPEGKG